MDLKRIMLLEKNAWSDEIPENAKEFVFFIQTQINKAPEEYRDRVEISFEYGAEYGADIEICYYRPKTQAEIEKEKLERIEKAKQKEENEKAELKRLQKKYHPELSLIKNKLKD